MRGRVLPWIVAVGLLLAVTVGGVAFANATVFSASGFVKLYLSFLTLGDARSALAMPGVQSGPSSDAVLTHLAAGGVTGVRVVKDTTDGNGEHRIRIRWTHGGKARTAGFEIEPAPAALGVFPQWRFAVSPLATLRVAVVGDRRFRVDGSAVSAVTSLNGTGSAEYRVLVPGVYAVDAQSRMLAATPHNVTVDTAHTTVTTTVQPHPTTAFVAATDAAVHAALESCTTQTVLLPTGCGFGYYVTDRVTSPPVWTMVTFPRVTALQATDVGGVWNTPSMPATAHVKVSIESLFDGTTSTVGKDVGFDARYAVSLDSHDRPVVTAIDIPGSG